MNVIPACAQRNAGISQLKGGDSGTKTCRNDKNSIIQAQLLKSRLLFEYTIRQFKIYSWRKALMEGNTENLLRVYNDE